MITDEPITWSQSVCRKAISSLKDGKPPPSELISFLSVGREDCLAHVQSGLQLAQTGGYDITVLEGRYGIGKSHLLGLVEVLAEEQSFAVKRFEVGQGGVHFNKPRELFNKLLGGESKPWDSQYYRYGPYYNDDIRRFVAGLVILAHRHRQSGKMGLVILLDELENSFQNYQLPNFLSRAKGYRVLGALFHGGVDADRRHSKPLKLGYISVVLAITPGTLSAAANDGPSWRSFYDYENPAQGWTLPKQTEVVPLTGDEAVMLSRRIRMIHGRALGWEADHFVDDEKLQNICSKWLGRGAVRDERELVRQVIAELEIAEQNQ